MSRLTLQPTGRERRFADDEIIVSKTDPTGKITYVNDVFCHVSGYARGELLGVPHSVIRHPAMPRSVFALLWQTIQSGAEMFAYVVNLCKGGDHYWVYAHVTPTFGPDGGIVGYHSNRRTPERRALPVIESLYAQLRSAEAGHARKADAVAAGAAVLDHHLQQRGQTYDEFIWSL
mgnify:CR=1 FL=1